MTPLVARLPRRRTPAPQPPRVDVDTGTTVGGAVLRAAVLVVSVAYAWLALQLVGGIDVGTRWAVAVAAGALVAWLCVPPAPHVLVVLGGLALAGETTRFAPLALVLVLLAHLVVRAAWWAAHVPPSARVELRALLPDARRFVVIQAVVQLAGVLLLLVAGTATSLATLAVGAAALLVLTVVLLRRA